VNIDDHKPDIVCGCESKLDNTIKSEEVFPTDEYEIYRKDKKKGEGGVFIAVNNNIVATPKIILVVTEFLC
jgi:exonuclease III